MPPDEPSPASTGPASTGPASTGPASTGPASTGPASTIMTEGYAGLENQALGLAEAACLAPAICRITPRPLHARLPAAWWPRPARAVTGLEGLGEGLLISAGGTAAAVAAALRRRDRRTVVCVQNPRLPLDRFDLVVANAHDGLSGPNLIVTRTALHRASPEALSRASDLWRPRLGRMFGRPDDSGLLAVLVGGSNGRFRLDVATAAPLAAALVAGAARRGLRIALTPSRRTAPPVVDLFRDALRPVGGWVWDGGGENPYLGLLSCASAIVVTADSISMVSEACATGAPVFVAALPGRSRRIARFLDLLTREGRIRRFDGDLAPWPVRPIDDTAAAAHEMRHRLGW